MPAKFPSMPSSFNLNTFYYAGFDASVQVAAANRLRHAPISP
ncbi:hypothetical protein [Paenibacillus qinlingensis]|nr:hypothetical protein [Paenibacillus qinlingensis]